MICDGAIARLLLEHDVLHRLPNGDHAPRLAYNRRTLPPPTSPQTNGNVKGPSVIGGMAQR